MLGLHLPVVDRGDFPKSDERASCRQIERVTSNFLVGIDPCRFVSASNIQLFE
jgi:hypothetical protein